MKPKPIIRLFQIVLVAACVCMNFEGSFTPAAKAGSPPIQLSRTQTITEPSYSKAFNNHGTAISSDASTSSRANPSILVENERSIQIELITKDFDVQEIQVDGKICQVLSVEKYSESQIPGFPRLPVYGTMVGIPADSQPNLSIIKTEALQVDGLFNLCPAGKPVLDYSVDGQPEFKGEVFTQDTDIYNRDSYYPTAPAQISDPAVIRSQRVIQLQFNPFQYNPVKGQLQLYQRIVVQVDYATNALIAPKNVKTFNEGAFESVLQDNLVNYDVAAEFRTDASATSANFVEGSSGTGLSQAKILVNQPGMISVSYEDLAAAGLDLGGANPATFQVFDKGIEIAIDVEGDEDGLFGSGDKVVFYGQPANTRYTDTNVYWLSWGSVSGRRMSVLSAPSGNGKSSTRFIANQHLENNNIYKSSVVDVQGDHWFWAYLAATTAPASGSFEFSAYNLDPTASTGAHLRGSIKSNSANPQHHTKIYLNNNYLAEGYWNTGSQFDFDVPFPMSYLMEGANTIRVDIPFDNGTSIDSIYINWFEVYYCQKFTAAQDFLTFNGETSGTYNYQINGFTSPDLRLYDITDPASVVSLTDFTVEPNADSYQLSFKVSSTSQRRYMALTQSRMTTPPQLVKITPSNLKSTANGADYLLITASDFIPEMQRLADWRANQGLRVQMIDVQEIYDEFNYGMMDPAAIRDFIAYAYQNWQPPAPQFVLLAGDGHSDPRNYKGTNEKVFIPAYLLPVDPYMLETASDNRYVTVSGSDNFPDLIIGRLPIKTRSEAASLVTKLIDYEKVPFDVDWNNRVLFVADNPDNAGSYYTLSDKVVNNYLPQGYSPSKVYFGSTHTTTSSAQTEILNQINQGSLLVNYVGHGTSTTLANENLLHTSSISAFTNTGKLPMFAMMACLTGSFQYPSPSGVDNSSIAEAILKAENKGAIATLGSTGMGVSTGQDFLNRGLYQAIFYEGKTQVGAAVFQAKLYLYGQTSSFRDLLDTFTLFGDPATRLNVRPTDLTVQLEASPEGGVSDGMPITYTLTYRNIGLAQASHVRVDHPLPELLVNTSIQTSDANAVQISGSRIAWEIESLAPGAFGTIKVTGTVNAANPTLIRSQASIESPIPDSDPSNNSTPELDIPVNGPTAVLLESASAAFVNSEVSLSWTTANELDLLGFNVYRSTMPDQRGVKLNEFQIMGQNAGSLNGSTYNYVDMEIQRGETYYYHLEIVEIGGTTVFDFQPVTSFNITFLPFLIR